jgi:hypothetical protein
VAGLAGHQHQLAVRFVGTNGLTKGRHGSSGCTNERTPGNGAIGNHESNLRREGSVFTMATEEGSVNALI